MREMVLLQRAAVEPVRCRDCQWDLEQQGIEIAVKCGLVVQC
jgi:predicted Zn-ribbon and HTH transcriptional regulator